MARDRIIKEDYTSGVRKVLIYTLVLNSAVAFAKILYGQMTDSIAMTSDGLHSFMDGVSNIIGLRTSSVCSAYGLRLILPTESTPTDTENMRRCLRLLSAL